LVTSNAVCAEFNASSTQKYCIENREQLHRYAAVVRRPRFTLSEMELRSLRSIRDDKTGNMPVMLDIAVGMPIQCTKNVSKRFRLANGSIGIAVDLQDDPTDDFTTRTEGGYTVVVHTALPEIVYVKLLAYSHIQFHEDLPDGVVPVRPRRESNVLIKITDVRSFIVCIIQIPIIPAFALTTEKCQGLTVEKMILGPLRHPTRKRPQRSALYVAITRVKSMSQLYLMKPLTLSDLAFFRPDPAALRVTERLLHLDA